MKLFIPVGRWCFAIVLSACVGLESCRADDAAAKADPRYPFRTDFANADLPWYKPKPGEFPPHHSEHRIGGELVSADFIHRRGQFRVTETGELAEFILPPYGSVNYLDSDADPRDVPLGTFCLFFLNQDAGGGFTHLATLQDQFTVDAGQGFSYQLDNLKPGEGKLGEGKLGVTRRRISRNEPDLGKSELLVNNDTRVWKGDKQVKLGDLAAGDDLLFNLTGKTARAPGRCTDLWIGAETHKLVTERQRKSHADFIKARGVAGWIDRVEGDKLTVTLFTGDPGAFTQIHLGDFAIGKDPRIVVANDELRTWNPPVDQERCKLIEIRKGPVDGYGASGVQLVVTVTHMLEGFRKGRIVRVFAAAWPSKDQFYGESLMNYGYDALKSAELLELTPKEYPTQFPFRTDYGNDTLPWYQLKAGAMPPRFSEHRVFGELLNVDAAARCGRFRADRTGELVDFTLIPKDVGGSVKYLNAEAGLSDLPLGTRCRFNLYQDEKGAFTRASLITDEFSYLALNAVTYRVEAMKLNEGKLHVARQIPEVKNYNGDMEQPPDIGRTELLVNADTRVWKGAGEGKLTDLAIGDALLVNLTSEQPGAPSRCTDLWVGAETHQRAHLRAHLRAPDH